MTSSDPALDKQSAGTPEGLTGKGLRIGIVAARWNREVVDRLREGVDRGLRALDVAPDDVVELSVPGSFEVPTARSCRGLRAGRRGDHARMRDAGRDPSLRPRRGECARGVQDASSPPVCRSRSVCSPPKTSTKRGSQ